MPRKYLSGSQKRKRRQRVDDLIRSQAGALDKFFGGKKQAGNSSSVEDVENEEHENLGNEEQEDLVNEEDQDLVNEEPKQCTNETRNEDIDDGNQNEDTNSEFGPLDIDDPSNWDRIDRKFIDFIVERGPLRRDDDNFPTDKFSRHFSSAHYIRQLSNGEKQDRRWLVYSHASDIVFCFCCKLFKQDENKTLLATKGFKDWRNLSQRLKSHEGSNEHISCMSKWTELELRLKTNKTIDRSLISTFAAKKCKSNV